MHTRLRALYKRGAERPRAPRTGASGARRPCSPTAWRLLLQPPARHRSRVARGATGSPECLAGPHRGPERPEPPRSSTPPGVARRARGGCPQEALEAQAGHPYSPRRRLASRRRDERSARGRGARVGAWRRRPARGLPALLLPSCSRNWVSVPRATERLEASGCAARLGRGRAPRTRGHRPWRRFRGPGAGAAVRRSKPPEFHARRRTNLRTSRRSCAGADWAARSRTTDGKGGRGGPVRDLAATHRSIGQRRGGGLRPSQLRRRDARLWRGVAWREQETCRRRRSRSARPSRARGAFPARP